MENVFFFLNLFGAHTEKTCIDFLHYLWSDICKTFFFQTGTNFFIESYQTDNFLGLSVYLNDHLNELFLVI